MPTKIIGHRGAAGLEPENTLRSFDRALQLGVQQIEFDVRLTSDRHAVIFHDETLDRLTAGKGRVSDHSLSDLQGLSVGGEKIPLLAEVLDKFKDKVEMIVELKDPHIEFVVLDIIKQARAESQVTVISFWHESIFRISQKANVVRAVLSPTGRVTKTAARKALKTGLLLADRPMKILRMVEDAFADGIFMHIPYITPDLIHELHAKKRFISGWNTDDPNTAFDLMQWGIDSIGTDRPDIILEAIVNKGLQEQGVLR